MKNLTLLSAYIFLAIGIISGVVSNGFLKSTEGFTKITPVLFSIISIIVCLFCLSKTMTIIPIGFTYATYGGLTISAVTILGILKYNQTPNVFGTIGLALIILGVILLNTLGKVK